MTRRLHTIRRLVLAASVVATLAGLAELWLTYRSTGVVRWAHLAEVLSYPLAAMGMFGWVAARERDEHAPSA